MADKIKIGDFEVKIGAVRELVDPYTGNKLVVVGRIAGPLVMYSAPKAFSLAEPQTSIERLYDRASMRMGVEGAVTRDQSMYDAYTGRRLELRTTPDGKFYFSGGFNPRRATTSLEEFVRSASCGKVNLSKPPEMTTIEHLPGAAPETDAPHEEVAEKIEEAAHDIAKAIGADRGRTTVSMADTKKRGKGRTGR